MTKRYAEEDVQRALVEAEERGAGWMRDAAVDASSHEPFSHDRVRRLDPAQVCAAARMVRDERR